MVKLIPVVNVQPLRKGSNFKNYMCNQTILRKMILNLEKMPYITVENRNLFFSQVLLILKIIGEWYQSTGFDLFLHLNYQLLNFLKGDACAIDNVRIMITNYNNKLNNFFANKRYFEKSIKECNKSIIVFPLLLVHSNQSEHANLLVIDIRNKLAWRIEPNAGTTFDIYDKYINPNLLNFFKEYNIRYLYNFPGECPIWLNRLPQFIVKYIPLSPQPGTSYLEHSGLCMFLSVGKFIYGKTLTNEILRDFIVRFFKNELKSICAKV